MIKQAEEYIYSIPKFAAKTSLDNTRHLLNVLGITEAGMKIIHVAGTNGKGSVCAYLSSALVCAGKKTGLFTSPHLVQINERIRINNIPVSDEMFLEAYNKVRAAADKLEAEGFKHPSFFEFLFGMAMLIFSWERIEYLVLETGLGGRLDSTNVFDKPVMTIITSVSLDHMQILGETIEEIAAEKAGIIKNAVPLVFYGEDKRVRAIIEAKAEEMNAPYSCVDNSKVSDILKKDKFIDFSINNEYYCNESFRINTQALYQVYNATIAATALAGLGIDREKVHTGIKNMLWEGRMEEVLPDVYVDGAHNEDGIRMFLETARSMKDRRQILMFSAVADKNFEEMIRAICQSEAFDEYVVCTVENEKRAMPAVHFVEIFKQYTTKQVHLEATAKGALEKAFSLKKDNERLFIAGSLYLVGEVKHLINMRNEELDND